MGEGLSNDTMNRFFRGGKRWPSSETRARPTTAQQRWEQECILLGRALGTKQSPGQPSVQRTDLTRVAAVPSEAIGCRPSLGSVSQSRGDAHALLYWGARRWKCFLWFASTLSRPESPCSEAHLFALETTSASA